MACSKSGSCNAVTSVSFSVVLMVVRSLIGIAFLKWALHDSLSPALIAQ